MQKKYIKPVVFISGHRDLTQEEFDLNYGIQLDWLITQEEIEFVIGDYDGCDTMAQEYLTEQGFDPSRVTIYHMGDKPMNLVNKRFKTIGGFENDIDRDCAMTNASTYDVAYIRKGKENSGTAQNILRRFTF